MIIGVYSLSWWVLSLLAALSGAGAELERWVWADTADSEPAAAERVDGKVRFIDVDDVLAKSRKSPRGVSAILEEVPFALPTDTQGFYNRPPGAGRYRVRVDAPSPAPPPPPPPPPRHRRPYLVDRGAVYHVHSANRLQVSGTLDALPYCKCVSEPDCSPRTDLPNACEQGKYLCCYNQNQPNKNNAHKAEYFNEVEDERPSLLPGQAAAHGAFPPPPDAFQRPAGVANKPVLVGPGGPTGIIGPGPRRDDEREDFDDLPTHNQLGGRNEPQGPVDRFASSASAQRGVLVGPGGPTGIIGPGPRRDGEREDFNDLHTHNHFGGRYESQDPFDRFASSASAQRGVLVGPGGPTGIIGPGFQRPTYRGGVLVGPGGPTGYVGPAGYRPNPGLLVGPGGPTGIIGPRGPRRNYYFGK